MRFMKALSRPFLVISVIASITFGLPHYYGAPVSGANARYVSGQTPASTWTPQAEPDGFVFYEDDGKAICRPATAEEAESIQRRDVPLREIFHEGFAVQEAGDVNITLRGTAQLDGFPLARVVFMRAADIWKSKIQTMGTAITIIVDVDFGPTRFGTPFPTDVLGSTGSQLLGNSQGYPDVRNGLVSRASSAQETSLYASLPASSIPTEIGTTTGFVAPSSLLRTLGIIPPVADPTTEQAQFGSPPSIGFNSNFSFDFNPDDGIGANMIDFEAVAAHEIGHALGFSSRVGATELGATPAVSVLDLFRFRPGTTLGTFGTAMRVLSSGGSQMFFAGSPELPLSTGRPDGTGGDGNQAAHWKDSSFVGMTIGIMDPNIAFGERQVITNNDLMAYDALGYQLKPVNNSAPAINSIRGNLQGDVVTLTGTVADAQGDITQAQTSLLDDSNNVLVQNAPVAVSFGGQTSASYNLQISGLNNRPTAMRASLVFIDSQANRSAALSADFSQADPGGPTVNKASFGTKLVIKGGGLFGLLEIEVNGLIVKTKDNGSDGKAKIGGSEAALNLRSGANRVRVIKGGLRSNTAVATL